MKCLFRRAAGYTLGVGLLIGAYGAIPAQAAVNTSQCGAAEFSQPFLYTGDNNFYTLPGGESYDNFGGQGWQLSGGAQVVSQTLSDGRTGNVLNLPSGSKAVSPVLCVTAAYPTARGIVRDVKGSEGVQFFVEYEGTNTWGNPKNTGQIHGSSTTWTPATPVNLQPSNALGWQPMRITLVPGGKTSDFQVYNLYADPRMR